MELDVQTSRLICRDTPIVRTAIAFAHAHLSSITRGTGETYFQHGIEVATTLEEVCSDTSLIVVAILHDILMHPNAETLLKQSSLSAEQIQLAHGMHRLRRLHTDLNAEELDRMITAFAEDSRLLLLRMAHRLNDVRHLERYKPQRRKEVAHETLAMYTAISGRLGFQRWRWQMEDICFRTLQPSVAKRMQQHFDDVREIDRACLTHARTFLERTLKQHGIDAIIDERIKGLYSSYRKMVLKNQTFEELTDRLALRILVPEVSDCYRALGIIHQSMHPIHGKFKDYIGTPKENGYRSIHTVVYPLPGITELPIEIQIRTHEMHDECEYGVASHGKYKNALYSLATTQTRNNLLRNLESLHAVVRSQATFKQALKHSFSDKRLLVFDAHNNIYHLHKPSTAWDFVQHILQDRAHDAVAVRINGRERPLDTPLHDGDIVETMMRTGNNQDSISPMATKTVRRTSHSPS